MRHFGFRQAAPRWWLVLVILVGLAGYAYFGRSHSAAEVTTITGRTMGTTYRVLLGTPQTRAAAEELEQAIATRLAEINATMSTYEPTSEVSRFNQHRSTEPFAVSGELSSVISLALGVSRDSGGAFDITVAPLVNAWGFGAKGRVSHPPDEAELRALQHQVGHDKLSCQGLMLKKTHPDLEIDLSGIAKGYAVDEVAALLDARGLRNHLVEIGGELRVQGRNAQGRSFRVGIEQPREHGRAVRLALNLESGALATSGNYRNYAQHGSTRSGHLVDPVTARPATNALLSASVWHPSCAVADAWATALMVVGPDEAFSLAEANGLEVVLLLAEPNGEIAEQLTPAIARHRLDRFAARSQ